MKKPIQFAIVVLAILAMFVWAFYRTKKDVPTVPTYTIEKPSVPVDVQVKDYPCPNGVCPS